MIVNIVVTSPISIMPVPLTSPVIKTGSTIGRIVPKLLHGKADLYAFIDVAGTYSVAELCGT